MTEPGPQRGEIRHSLRERQILDAAYALLREKGFIVMSMDDVAHACGISKATLYKHFESKDELAVAVIEEGMARSEGVFLALPADLSPLRKIEALLQIGVERRTRHAPIPILQMPAHLWQHPRLEAQRRAMFTRMASLVSDAVAAGEVRDDVPVDLLVGFLMMTFGPGLEQLAAAGGVAPELVSARLMPVILDGLIARSTAAPTAVGPAEPGSRP